MNLFKKSALAFVAFASSLASVSTVYAENISLRLSYTEGRTGVSFSPIHAEVGTFGLTPSLPGHAEGAQWRVVAKDAKGTVLYEVLVKNSQQRHIEVFDQKTGSIELVDKVKQATGVFEVSLPFDKEISSVEVLPQISSANSSTGSNITRMVASTDALAKFDRASLEKMLITVKTQRSQNISATAAAIATATTIINSGPANARMDYVFVGDGYTAAEMSKWRTDAQKVIDGFMADPLFAANRGNMNVRRVDIASNQSGVDEPDLGIYRDTAMDGAFNCYNIARLLCVTPAKVYNIVGSVLAPDERDVIIVISNSTRYGGSGGEVATLSMHAQSVEIALHEIGHTAFALADEYEYGTCDTRSEPTEGDVSLNGTRSVKWGSLISANTAVPTSVGSYANGTVGAFQGAQYCTSGKYRPTENSRMRTLGYPWHAVNEGLAAKVFAKYRIPTTSTVTQSGILAAGASAYAPSAAPGYIQAGSGNFILNLLGPASSDFDLTLYKYVGSAWTKVASSEGSTSTEAINYAGTAGYYYAEVKSYSGSGVYTLKYSFPPK